MKKTIAIALVLIFIFSCKKDNSNGAYGSWTVNGVSYQATVYYNNVVGSPGTFVVSNSAGASSPTSIAVMNFNFYDSLPSTSGTFHVINADSTLTALDQVQITTELSNAAYSFYNSTGTGSNQNITVTISGGKISATGSGINISNGTGTATLGFDIHE